MKGERKGERSEYRQELDLIYISLTAKGIEIRRAGKTQSAGQAENPTRRAGKTRRAETLTHEDTQIIQWAARLNHTTGGKTQSAGQAETSPQPAETLTLEGTNQDIKESGHPSRRPPAHKGYNQFIKDAKRSQRAKRLSQPKQMERKIGSSAQTCRNVNREQTLHIERRP